MTRDGIAQSPPFYAPVGAPFPNYDTGTYQGLGATSGALCLYDGVPHVAWTEMFGVPPFNSRNPGFASGPFVARDDGGAWSGVGMTIGGGNPNPFEVDSDTFLVVLGPSAAPGPYQRGSVALATDGSSLFLAYLVQMQTMAIFESYNSILQENIYSFGYGNWLRVWEFDGASWSYLGSVETELNQTQAAFGGGNIGPVLSADPAGVGSCYASYFESGVDGTHNDASPIKNFWVAGFGAEPFVEAIAAP